MATEVPVGQNKVNFYANLFRSYIRRNKIDLARQTRNWGMYSGVNMKQWDPIALQQLIDERRAPHQINFCQKTIDDLAGNFYQNDFELDFESNTGTGNDASLLMKDLYLTDKNIGGWQKARRKWIRAGLVFRGTVELYKDYKTDPLGTISIRYINPNRILFDPDWNTDNMNDNKHVIQYSWMTPDDIKLVYNKSSKELEEAIKMFKNSIASRVDETNSNRNPESGGFFIDSPEFLDIINNRFLVIQTSRLERGVKEQLLDMESGEVLPEMDEENTRGMMALRGKSLKVLRNTFARLKVNTVVPGLSNKLMLQDNEDHNIQIGRYQYFNWSANNIDGEVQGVMDRLSDLQQIYNKRESTFTHWQTTVANGTEFIEDGFFADDTEFERYKDSGNVPGSKFKTTPNAISGGRPGIMNKPRGDIPNDLHASADRSFNMVPQVTPVTPALTGGEGKSGESSRLFESKRAQALVSLEPMSLSLQDGEMELGEAYFYLAKQMYSGAQRRKRSFLTKEPLDLNVPLENGQVFNDVARIPRQNIIVKVSKNGDSVKRELLNRNVELLNVVQNPIYRSQIEKSMISQVPNIPDEEIEAAKIAADKFIELQTSRIDVELVNNQAIIKQAQAQQQGPQSVPPGGQGQLPPPEESLSVEGASVTPGEGVPVDVNNVNQLR